MPLDALAPDQRAVVQLVLQRERSYAEIAELLGISQDAVRDRAHAGLSALAPEIELPADKVGRLSDYLLGQQNGKPRQATRRLLTRSDEAREWASTVAAALDDIAGDRLPSIPQPRADNGAAAGEAEPAAEAAPSAEEAPAPDAAAPRPRPLRGKPAPTLAAKGAPSSSRRGGALLIGGVVVALVALLLWLFVFSGGNDEDTPAADATPTPTASASPQAVGEIRLRGVDGSAATGVMRLFASQGQLAFTLEGQKVPQSRSNEAYAVWFVGPGSKAQRLGFAQPVGKEGTLGTTGPREEDLSKFPEWLASFRQVVVSRERDQTSKTPGPVVLRGTLPRGSG